MKKKENKKSFLKGFQVQKLISHLRVLVAVLKMP